MTEEDRRTWLKRSAAATLLGGSGMRPALAVPPPPPVRLGVIDLSFHRATAAVVTAVLARLGHDVVRTYALHEACFEHLRQGEVDMLASAWLNASHGIYRARVEEVTPTRELGLHYAPYALWGVPDYVPASAVRSVPDLLRPEVQARMTPRIQGIGAGAGITRFSQRMMEAYGLTAAGYRFETGTQEACFTAFEQAVRERRWVVVPLWRPQFLHARHHIRELEDPRGLLGGVDRAVLLAREDRLGRLPEDTVRALDRIQLSNEVVSHLDDAVSRQGLSPDEAAAAWLVAHPDRWTAWLTPPGETR